jgi:membrane protease YdiL (CAAX protease family)
MIIWMNRVQQRLVALGEVIICSSLPTQLTVAILLSLAGMPSQNSSGQLSLPFVFAVTIGDTVLLVGLMVWFTLRHGETVSSLWLGSRPIASEVVRGLALVPPIFLVVIVLLNILRLVAPDLHNVEVNPLEQLATGGPLNAVVFGVVVIVAGGVREEMVRAFLLRRFEQHLGGTGAGVILLSVAFGLGHVGQGWDAAITTGVLGALWAVVYVRRRSSIAPIVSHAGFNSVEVIRIALTGA